MENQRISVALAILLLLNTSLGFGASSNGNNTNGNNQNQNTPPGNNNGNTPGNTNTGNGSQPNGGGNQPNGPTGNSQPSATVFFESQTLGYAAIDKIAAQIGRDICAVPNHPSSVLIFDQTTFANLQVAAGFFSQMHIVLAAFQAFVDNPPDTSGNGALEKQVATLNAEITQIEKTLAELGAKVDALQKSQPAEPKEELKPKLGIALTAAESVLSALGPYITASRSDTGTTFVPTDAAIAMNVSHYVRGCGTSQVIYPRIALPNADADTWNPSNPATLGGLLAQLFKTQRQAAKLIQAYEDVWTLQQASASPAPPAVNPAPAPAPAPPAPGLAPKGGGTPGGGGPGGQTQNPAPQNQAQSLSAKTYLGSDYLMLASASGLLNSFLSAYTQPVGSATVPAYAQLGSALQLLFALAQKNTAILFLEGSAAGGTQRVTKNLLTNLFWGNIISYSGGAVIAYGLIDVQHGALLTANTYHVLSPYTHINTPKHAKDLNDGDNFPAVTGGTNNQ